MEFKANRSKVISYRIIGVMLFAVGLFLLFIREQVNSETAMNVLTVIAFLFILCGLRIYLGTVGTELTIDRDVLTVTHLFRTRSIRVDDVSFYRYGGYDSFYLLLNKGRKRFRLPRVLAANKELISWVQGRFPEFERAAWEQDRAALLQNEQFGNDPGERDARLKRAANLETMLTIWGGVLLLWTIFYPKPLGFLMLLVFLAPWIGVYFTWRYAGLLKLYKKRRSPYPSLIAAMAMPVIAAGLVLPTYHVYEYPSYVRLIVLAGTVLFSTIALYFCKKGFTGARYKWLTGALFVLVVALYSYFLLLFSNCYLDESLATVSKVEVTGTRTTSGKTTNYYISVSPWGHYESGEEVNVTGSIYHSVHTGDSVNVYLQEGRWGIPWYDFLKAE